MKTTLYGWGSMFDLPSPSPFVMKADIHLQMLGIPFERAIADLDSVDKHKAPYVRDDGVVVQDSAFIRRHFEKKLGVDLDRGLTPEQRGLSWALEKMLERHLQPIEACERWLIDENFERGPQQFFAGVPAAMRDAVIAQVRGDFAKTMHGSGFSRYSRQERMTLARADIAAAASLLGTKAHFFGDTPTAVDGAAFGVLAGCATRFFESELPDIVAEHPNLVAYLNRMRKRFFETDRWPKIG